MTLSIVEFGDELLRTGDLDPAYVAVANCGLDEPTLHRLCVAYWCFYHLGVAAYLAEYKVPTVYWSWMAEVAANKDLAWPRGSERRHFRAEAAKTSVRGLIQRYKSASDMVRYIAVPCDPATPTFGGVSARVEEHAGFGPWMGFKIADMAERVLGYNVDFSNCQLKMFKDPRQGAALAFYLDESPKWQTGHRFGNAAPYAHAPWTYPASDENVKESVDKYVALWRKKRAKAPPAKDRLVNIQEIETIFCKYKSHYKGHYPVGKDTREIGKALEGWGDLAQQLQKGLPSGA